MSEQKPTIGRIVHYTLTANDADEINKLRQESAGTKCGNVAHEGQVYPLIITHVWGDQPSSAFNGSCFLDGNDLFWVTSTEIGEGKRKCQWPSRA